MSFVQVEMILQALEYEMGRLSDELICSASMAFSFKINMFLQNTGRCWMSFSFRQQVESATSSETVCNWSFLII